MGLTIEYTKKALKTLNKMDTKTRKTLTEKIEQYAKSPESFKNRIVALKEKRFKGWYRLKIGDYRIIFDNKGHILYIIDVDVRGEVYKRS